MGLLQVIQRVDERHEDEEGYNSCTPELSDAAARHLTRDGIVDYGWQAVSPYYSEYVEAERRLRAQSCSAYRLIGNIGRDWHPAGYSRVVGHPRGHELSMSVQLALPEGTVIPIPDFGSRAFLLANLSLAEIGDRVMIDFDNPDEDRIPDLAPIKGGSLAFGN